MHLELLHARILYPIPPTVKKRSREPWERDWSLSSCELLKRSPNRKKKKTKRNHSQCYKNTILIYSVGLKGTHRHPVFFIVVLLVSTLLVGLVLPLLLATSTELRAKSGRSFYISSDCTFDYKSNFDFVTNVIQH